MLGRIILVIVALALVLFLVRRALAAARPGEKKAASESQGDLVTCAHCGVNLPKSEARSAGGRDYCSEEHWRLGPRDR
jgi:uncharacterized protein